MSHPDRISGVLAPALTALALSTLGCGPSDEEASAGPVPEGTPVAIAAEPRLVLGSVEGDPAEQFHQVVRPFLLPDGALVVPVAGAGEIRVFDRDGELTRSLGDPGEGPGEFVALNSAWARGDTIEAYDWRQQRITRFFPSDSFQIVQLERVGSGSRAVPGELTDGWLVVGIAEAGPGRRDRMVVRRFGKDGSRRDEVARVDGMSRHRISGGGGPGPLSPRAAFSLHDGQLYLAETLTPGIRVFAPDGTLQREITWQPADTLSPEAAFDAVVDAAVAEAPPEDSAETRRRLEAFPVGEHVSRFWSFLVDAEGFVWVEPYRPSKHSLELTGFWEKGPGGLWSIFSPEGRRVGAVEVPPGLEPTQVTADAVVGIRRNELGVEFVQVHALERR